MGWLKAALIVAVLTLIGQLCWPSIAEWRRRPTPGSFGIVTLHYDERDRLGLAALNAECVIRLPNDYGASAGPLPLVVFLHGGGECGNDIARLARYLGSGPFSFIARGHDFPALLVAPQCRQNRNWQPVAVATLVRRMASRYDVDSNRVYLVGYSMGGYGTWQTVAQYPELFAAAVPICGGGDVEDASKLAAIPIWAFHGAKDNLAPLEDGQRMIDAVRASGGHPHFTILNDSGHDICNTVLARHDVWDWLFQQHRDRAVDLDAISEPSPLERGQGEGALSFGNLPSLRPSPGGRGRY
jgi:poly(3-hydroxybutyrate) depolymerase